MKPEERVFNTDLAIIGTGLAGFAASTFALERGIQTAQAGNTGALAYTTGYLDLMGSVTTGNSQSVTNPWEALRDLVKSKPDHPLARISEGDIRNAFIKFTSFLQDSGISYSLPGEENLKALTPAGTIKKTLCVPITMQAGVDVFGRKPKCVIIDFKGLRGFSARQVVANLKDEWPGLWAERLSFPDMERGEIYPEVMARALEVAKCRKELAERILHIKGDAEAVGLPAILGMHEPDRVMVDIQKRIGLPVFEIPTMPPAVPGIRLREIFEQILPQKGLTLVPQQKVKDVEFTRDYVTLELADNYGSITIKAKVVIMATGRFLSGGLEAGIVNIVEPLLNLPVTQPASREEWYQKEYMDKRGHAINKCGVEVDDKFRPLGSDGCPVDNRLFAAGILLAHQDWIRERCGAGVAIASAYKAVEFAHEYLKGNVTIQQHSV